MYCVRTCIRTYIGSSFQFNYTNCNNCSQVIMFDTRKDVSLLLCFRDYKYAAWRVSIRKLSVMYIEEGICTV